MNSEPALSLSKPAELPQQAIPAFAHRVGLKTLFAVTEWLAHCLVVTVILFGMKGLELLSDWLWKIDRHFVGAWISIHDMFAVADFVLLAVILVLGIGCVIKAYRS